MHWFAAMAEGGEEVRCRCYMIRQPRGRARLTFDASLTGGGAFLEQDGMRTCYMHCAWEDADRQALGAWGKEAKDQPLWEAYMLLIAVAEWTPLLHDGVGKLAIRGDAQGVLQAAIKGRAKLPLLNSIIAEIQLNLAKTKFDLYAVHIWSERNELCDQLSRVMEGASIPEVCAQWQWKPRTRQERWRVLEQD